MSKNKKNNGKNWNDKYRLVPDDIVKNLVEFLDEIQFEAAKDGGSDGVQVINICNYLIAQLINSVEAHPYKKYDRNDKLSDHIIELPDMDDEEFDKLVSQFDKFLRGWEKEYNEGVNKKSKKSKKGDFKPHVEDIMEYCSLKEVEEFLKDDPELTDYERFELYYDERERRKPKVKGLSYEQLLKGAGIKNTKKKK